MKIDAESFFDSVTNYLLKENKSTDVFASWNIPHFPFVLEEESRRHMQNNCCHVYRIENELVCHSSTSQRGEITCFLCLLVSTFFFFGSGYQLREQHKHSMHGLHALTANILMWLQYTILNTLTLYILIIHPSSLLGFVGLL